MIMQVCAVLDKKVGAFSAPQVFRSRGEAIRSFMDACASAETPFARHAEDYSFFVLAEYDDNTGQFLVASDHFPVQLITGLECAKTT